MINLYTELKSILRALIKPLRYKELLFNKSILNYYKNFYKYSSNKINSHSTYHSLSRIDIINTFIQNKSVSEQSHIKYLEIGCSDNNCFNNVNLPLSQKTGVDPIKGGTHRMTSDVFFENCTDKFDIIFIDGLHIYGQVQKDIINSLSFLTNDGKIIIHDMIPKKWEMECVPRIYNSWNGDVWKIGLELEKSSGVKLKIFDCDYGVGVVEKLSFDYKYHKMNNILHNQNFKDFFNYKSILPIYPPTLFHDLFNKK